MGAVIRPLIGDDDAVAFAIPLTAIPLLIFGSLLLAASIAAAMMIFAVFARTFKEGQAMVSPIYLVTFLPMLFLLRLDLELSLGLAFIPVVNVSMMVRSAVRGSFPLLPIAVTLVVQVVVIAGLLRLASAILAFEDVLTGSFDGNLVRFLRNRLFAKSRPRTV